MAAAIHAGDVVVADFPGVTGIKRRPAIVLSSDIYHSTRPDMIIGLVTSQAVAKLGPTDYALEDWAQAGLRVPSIFRCFLVTLPKLPEQAVIGRLTDRDWEAVCARLKTAFTPLGEMAS